MLIKKNSIKNSKKEKINFDIIEKFLENFPGFRTFIQLSIKTLMNETFYENN
jgi:hypothetical protein